MLTRLRLRAVATAATIAFTMPAIGLARAASPSPTPPPSPARAEPSSSDTTSGLQAPEEAGSVVVRTVSAPGALSAAMRQALQSVGDLISSSAQSVHLRYRADGTTLLSSTSRFLSIAIVRDDPEGEARTMCVSSLDEALRTMASTPTPAAAAEKE